MATGRQNGFCLSLILFASLLHLVQVELNITSPEFSEADIEDNGYITNEAISLIGLPSKDKTPNLMKNSGTNAQLGKNKTKSIIQETNHEKVTKINETNESRVNTELLTLLHSQKNNKTTENSSKPEVATVKNDSQKDNYSIADTTLPPENVTPTENFPQELSTTGNSSTQMDHEGHVNISKKIDVKNDSNLNEHIVKPEELLHVSTPFPKDDTKVSTKTSNNSNAITNDITVYSITESSRVENLSNTLKLNTSKNLEYKQIPNSNVGTTQMSINSLTEEQLGNSEHWDSYNKTSAVQLITGIKEEYSTPSSTVYSPPLAKFILHSNFQEDPCIVIVMGIQISIKCDQSSNKVKSYKINVPENAYISGSCDKPQIMTISWLDEFNNTFDLTIKSSLIVPENESLEKEGESISITDISLKMKLDSKGFPGNFTLGGTFSASNFNLFKSPVNQIYLSRQTQLVKSEAHIPKTCSVILILSNVQFQAYISPSHNKAVDSMLIDTSNSTMKVLFISVPVGLLGTLLVISFVIYMRKRLCLERSFNV